MDRHDNLALSTAGITEPPQDGIAAMTDRDRESLHRLFSDMRRAIAGASHHRVAALPHP